MLAALEEAFPNLPQSSSPKHDALVADLDRAASKRSASILIVDDEPVNLQLAEAFLRDDGYDNITTCRRPEAVLSLIELNDPDVILLDVMMPGISGLDLLRDLRSAPATRHVPVIILTALSDPQTKSKALQLGATDFLTKPLDAYELLPRVRNALILRAHQRGLEGHAETLEQLVRQRTAELTWTQIQIVHCLARASEHRDNETGRHAMRVGRYAQILGRQLGRDEAWCERLLMAAMLHDVGKIGVPDAILLKPGRLDREEFQRMQEHCRFGHEIILPTLQKDLISLMEMDASGTLPNSPLLDLAASVALTHHERWDGSGYPRSLKGEDIPLEGRVTAVADVFDALGSERPYKPAFPLARCREIIREGAGSHFDPAVVQAFETRIDEIAAVREQLHD